MGILRVRNLLSPPYVSVEPSLYMHTVTSSDRFVILGSDGLFDFFTNDEAVKLVHSYISSKPSGDPARYLLKQLVLKAARSAGIFIGFSRKIKDTNNCKDLKGLCVGLISTVKPSSFQPRINMDSAYQ